MSRKLELTPRKVPRQSRAKATVDAILEATRRLLLSEGYQHMTTNHVAELAGTSIGTLYQYFPSIDSLCTSLYQQLKEELNSALGVTMAELNAQPLTAAPSALVDGFFVVYGRDAELNQLLCSLAPDIGAIRKVKDIDAESVRLLTDYLMSKEVEAAQTIGFTVFCTLDSVCHDGLGRDVHALQDPTLREGLVRMVEALLLKA